jgi:outer membrane protein assembly factor BamB
LEKKTDVDSANSYGRTALSLAASRGETDIMKLLIEAGAKLDSKDTFYGMTPLMAAMNGKQTAAVEVLVEAGVQNAGQSLRRAVSADVGLLKALLKAKDLKPAELRAALAAAKSSKKKEHIALLDPLVEALPAAKPKKKADATEKPKSGDMKKESDKPAMTLTADQLKAFTGLYVDPRGMEVQIKAVDGGLELDLGRQQITTRPVSKDEFISASRKDSTFRFVRNDGRVASMNWKAGETEIKFRRELSPNDKVETPEFEDYPLDSKNWPAFRGAMSRGVMNGQGLPDEWAAKDDKNIRWKTPVDGLGLSCPIVWGDSVYISTAVAIDEKKPDGSQLRTGLYGDVNSVTDEREYKFQLLCMSLSTGDVLWKRDCHTAKPKVKRHAKSSHANPTPATNGDYVVTSFSSEGVYCYTADGDLAWKKDFGFLDSGWFFDRAFQWGFASSPYIFEDTVYLQCDIQDQSFLVALDVKTGDEKWRTSRDDIPTWSSPVAYRDPSGKLRIAVNGTREAAVYDGEDGKRLWGLSGMSEIVVPTPQITPSYVMLASGYRPIRPILAIKHDAVGELKAKAESESENSDAFAWRLASGGSYLPTPLIADGFVHVVSNSGILSVFNATTGKRVSRVRLRAVSSCTGSPVAADGKLYVTGENGKTVVVPLGPNQKPLATNEIGEAVLTTPAIAGGRLLIRGENHVFAIGAKK